MRSRSDRQRRATATVGPRPATVEPLEGRAYCSMTIDLRVAATGGKTGSVTRVGQVVNLDAYAVIAGSTAGTNDAFLDAVGSFLGTEAGKGGVVGNLSATLVSNYTASGAGNGTQQDLNADGGLDVGSNSTSSTDGYFVARSGSVDYDGAVSGDTNTFLLATLTYTVTALGTGVATDLNFRPSGGAGGSYSALWVQDGNGVDATGTDSNFKIGTNVAITGPTSTPTPTPTPTVTQLTGTTYGTAGSYNNDGDTVAKATDGNLNTFFDAPRASTAAVGIDLGSAKAVSQIRFAPRGGYASRMVGGVFQASDSETFASGVVTVYTVHAAPASGSLTVVTPSTTAAYRYWRYYGPTNGYCNIAEFQLYGASTTLTQLTGTTIGTGGSYGNDGDTIAKATDGNLGTFFDAPTGSGAYVGLDLGSAKAVSQIRFAPRGGYASRMVGGYFQASNSSTFSGAVTVYTVSGTPASGSLTTVSTGTTTAYRYWRYVGPANSNCNIAEFELFG